MSDLHGFVLTIKSIDQLECYEYEVSFFVGDKRWSGEGTAPTIEQCFGAAMEYEEKILNEMA